MDEIKIKIRKFLSKCFRENEITDDDDFFSMGIVNSLFAMQLVLFIEKEFQVRVCNTDLDFQNFKSVQAIANLVFNKTQLKNCGG